MARLGALVAVLAAVGCSAQLRDGVYGCVDGNCPAGYVCWMSDRRCYTHAEMVVGDSGPRTDTGMMPMPDGSTMLHCPMTCPAGSTCAIGQFAPGEPTLGCIASATPMNHGMPCTMGGTTICQMPDACLPGTPGAACFRPCNPMNTGECQFMEDCVLVNTHPVCARACPGPCPTGTACNTSMGRCLPPGW